MTGPPTPPEVNKEEEEEDEEGRKDEPAQLGGAWERGGVCRGGGGRHSLVLCATPTPQL